MRTTLPTDCLSLPGFSAELLKEIKATRAKLEVQLASGLGARWAGSRNAQPEAFLPAWIAYAEGLYDVYAETLLRDRPVESDYRNWLDWGLKTAILDEIAPRWSLEETEAAARLQSANVQYSAWEHWMGWTYGVAASPKTDHRNARQVIESVRDYAIDDGGGIAPRGDGYRPALVGALHEAMSRRVPQWIAEWAARDAAASTRDGHVAAPAGDSPIRVSSKRRNLASARSRNQSKEALVTEVRSMKAAGLSQMKMCERLDANRIERPERSCWRHLTWRAAYRNGQYTGSVKKFLSKAGGTVTQSYRVTP